MDVDDGGEEFIGRALARPVVKLAEEKYQRPFFPPVLQWFPIYRGELRYTLFLAEDFLCIALEKLFQGLEQLFFALVRIRNVGKFADSSMVVRL